MGSVSDSVVRHAHCPVMVVRGEAVSFPARILLATEGSEESKLAASTAADLAKSTNSELHVVCVGHVPTILFESPEAVVLDPDLQSTLEEDVEEVAKTKLNEQVQQIGDAGIEVAGVHTRLGNPDAATFRLRFSSASLTRNEQADSASPLVGSLLLPRSLLALDRSEGSGPPLC
jgi:nucleotide-binding universal stress UspA family protein